jgi:hypothetical protein
MARSTGPILAIGGITVANQVLLNGQPFDWRPVLATGLAAGFFALAEKASPELAVGLAYVALVTIIFARVDPRIPAPAESALKWWEGGRK